MGIERTRQIHRLQHEDHGCLIYETATERPPPSSDGSTSKWAWRGGGWGFRSKAMIDILGGTLETTLAEG